MTVLSDEERERLKSAYNKIKEELDRSDLSDEMGDLRKTMARLVAIEVEKEIKRTIELSDEQEKRR